MADRGLPMDRGWNDPPMFQCEVGSESASAPPKSKMQLNKRVAYPSLVASKIDPNSSLPPKSNQFSEIASSPPRLHPFLKGAPPKAPFSGDDAPITCPIPSGPSRSSASSISEPRIQNTSSSSSSSSSLSSCEKRDKVIETLRTLIERIRKKGAFPEKQSSDIVKKVECLSQQWSGAGGGGVDGDPTLDEDAQEKLWIMKEAIETEKWGQALKIQVALAVDHAGAVKKWVMAIKKLLLAAQSHFPESSDEPLQQQPQPPSSQYFLPSHS